MFPANGPTFLVFYVALIAAAGLAYWCLRAYLLAKANERSRYEFDSLTPIVTPQIAGYLVDGPGRAGAAHVLQVYEGSAYASWEDLAIDAHLAQHGFILSRAARGTLSLWAVAMFGGLFTAGLLRFISGAARHKPVGFLLLLLIVVAVALYRCARHRLLRTRAGDKLLADLRSQHRGRDAGGFAMGFALLGWEALDQRADLAAHLHLAGYSPGTTAASASCIGICTITSASGCLGGCSSGGSGCSGGGGCGGGGCGGCS